jgi:hypothetical protein
MIEGNFFEMGGDGKESQKSAVFNKKYSLQKPS